MAHVLGRNRAWLFAHDDERLSPEQSGDFAKLIRRRAKGEPVAYLRGYVEWFGMRLAVSSSVLIPRPDTEVLVETAIQRIRASNLREVVDVGTGSGAIAIAVALNCTSTHVTGIDLDEAALRVARHNTADLGVGDSVTIIHSDLLEALGPTKIPDDSQISVGTLAPSRSVFAQCDPSTATTVHGTPELILANLPYLSDAMMAAVDIDVRHEPRAALLAGASGLELYERLLRQMDQRGWRIPALFEIDARQSAIARAMVQNIVPAATVTIVQDYAGLDRVLVIEP
jgi:release factor glutamine methyltransferase